MRQRIKIDKLQRLPLPLVVRDKIQQMIQSNRLAPMSRLPNEAEFAKMLNVSRSSLRAALRLLENEGAIVTRHGLGTFIRNGMSFVRNPLEISFGVTRIIESMGLRPGTAKLEIIHDKASGTMSEKLRLDPGSPIVILKRVRTADEKPLVYTIDVISEAILGGRKIPPNFNSSLYNFLDKKCNREVDYSLAKVTSKIARSEISEKLDIPSESIILLIEQIDYNMKNLPITYTEEYWRQDIIEFTIFRRHR